MTMELFKGYIHFGRMCAQ